MAEAAEKRNEGQQARGVKDPGSIKRMEEKREELAMVTMVTMVTSIVLHPCVPALLHA